MDCKKIKILYTLTDTEYRRRVAAGDLDDPTLAVEISVLDLSPAARVALLDLQNCNDWHGCATMVGLRAADVEVNVCTWPDKVTAPPTAQEVSERLLVLLPLHIAGRAEVIAAEARCERERVEFCAKVEAEYEAHAARQAARSAEREAAEVKARKATQVWLTTHCPADIAERYAEGVLPTADRHAAVREWLYTLGLGTPWTGPAGLWSADAETITAEGWATLSAVSKCAAVIDTDGAKLGLPEVRILRADDRQDGSDPVDELGEVIVIGLTLPDGIETRLRLAI